ncbi:MAG: RDD family protein [Candidatus Nanopelagicales bacterium]
MTTDEQEPLENANGTNEASEDAVAEPVEDAAEQAAGPNEDPIDEGQGESNSAAATQTATKKQVSSSLPYVSWGGRVLAYLIDVVPVLIVGSIANLIARATETTSLEVIGRNGGQDITAEVTRTSAAGIAIEVLAVIAILLYWFWNKGYREGTTGKSIGKQVLGFTTVDETTRRSLGAKNGCIRVLLLFVDFFICYIGVLWPLWDVKKQTFLSDRFTNAIVLRD